MQAVIHTSYGSPDDLKVREVDKPVPGDAEVLVRVRAASLHPDVWHVVRGRPYVLRLMGAGLSKPKNSIPGTDMAGVVEATGKSVTRFRTSDAVFGETIVHHQWTSGGAFAEYVAARQDALALKPDNITFEQAAAVPTSGIVALTNLRDRSRLRPGQRVLINGAGGGVGSLALQIAKAYGAHVTAVDAPSKLDMLRSLGADETIDYSREDFTRSGIRYDLIFDVPGNHPPLACAHALEPDGNYVLIGHERFGGAGGRLFGVIPDFVKLVILSLFVKRLRAPKSPMPDREEAMGILEELLEAGRITPMIDSTYPLSEVREAFRHMISNELHGKVILTAP